MSGENKSTEIKPLLLVDDDEDFSELLEAFLIGSHFKITTSSNMKRGYRHLAESAV